MLRLVRSHERADRRAAHRWRPRRFARGVGRAARRLVEWAENRRRARGARARRAPPRPRPRSRSCRTDAPQVTSAARGPPECAHAQARQELKRLSALLRLAHMSLKSSAMLALRWPTTCQALQCLTMEKRDV